MVTPSYFLIAVSTKTNLDLCIEYGLAGFTNSRTGIWTFCDLQVNDYISFLYSTKIYNLYKVIKKEVLDGASKPWEPITFRESGKTYTFPFRLELQLVRELIEPLVRAEFAYVAENLLLRAGYRKTHFQADQTTLSLVTQMGKISTTNPQHLTISNYVKFTPTFSAKKLSEVSSQVWVFQELVLQAALRNYLSNQSNLATIFQLLNLENVSSELFETLGEKAIGEGHIDLLIKQKTPVGTNQLIIAKVKLRDAKPEDLLQLQNYVNQLGSECIAGVLIAEKFTKAIVSMAFTGKIRLLEYKINTDWSQNLTFEEICQKLSLSRLT